MSNSSSSTLLHILIQLSEPLKDSLSKTSYASPEASPDVSIKSKLQTLLSNLTVPESEIRTKIKDFALCCAALASASDSSTPHLSWVPRSLSSSAVAAFKEFARAYYDTAHAERLLRDGEFEFDFGNVSKSEKRLVIELMPEVLPLLKGNIKESAIDVSDENDGVSAASARVPVAYAILASYQFRWFVTEVDAPLMGKLCPLVIPCALTALDHWSPEVKGQGMISFIYLATNVKAVDIGGFADVILDACCQNVASDDAIWPYVVEMSVLLVTLTQQSNPRSPWFEKLMNEMLNHLERQPRNKQRRTLWLVHVDQLFDCLGLILLAHFRRLFPLFFKWMHADDDETVLLVLERIITVLRLTWIRNSGYIERLIDELVLLYKDAALKTARERIRSLIIQMLTLIFRSNRSQFNSTWIKYRDDQDLMTLHQSLSEGDVVSPSTFTTGIN